MSGDTPAKDMKRPGSSGWHRFFLWGICLGNQSWLRQFLKEQLDPGSWYFCRLCQLPLCSKSPLSPAFAILIGVQLQSWRLDPKSQPFSWCTVIHNQQGALEGLCKTKWEQRLPPCFLSCPVFLQCLRCTVKCLEYEELIPFILNNVQTKVWKHMHQINNLVTKSQGS